MKSRVFFSCALLSAALLVGCTGSKEPADDQSGVEQFECVQNWTKVNHFRVQNTDGHLDEALAVAHSDEGGVFPEGTILQLIPTEAMVKQAAGTSPSTNDWEFFSLSVSETGTVILDRGFDENVKNQFNGSCLKCHSGAAAQWDFTCGSDHGCDPLPITEEDIEEAQDTDPRCI